MNIEDSLAENAVAMEGVNELRQLHLQVEAAGYGPDRIRIDPSVIRGLEYYTGPVFEAELTFPVTNEDGQVVRFGSVAGGGRYDTLLSDMGAPVAVPAVGCAIHTDRLKAVLT